MLMVMAYHFIPGVDRVAPLGSIGVRVFFVLSGFLITGILLDARGLPLGLALRTFYLRRSLRILPLFYAVLAVAAVINIGPVRQTLGWHVTYLTNAYLYLRGDWHGSISHLWSLAVEEQFYLVWPLVVLLLPLRLLPALIIAMVCLAPIARLVIGGPMSSVLPISCLDALGAGALLALPSTRSVVIRVGQVFGWPMIAAALAWRFSGLAPPSATVALEFGVALASAWAVGRASTGFSGIAGSLLASRPMVYIGTISYGLYLIHGFMPYILGRYVAGFINMTWPVRALLLTAATMIVAACSWRVFEKPILAFKDRWAAPLRQPRRPLGSARAVAMPPATAASASRWW